ncbi:peroxiredoxin family protein [Aureibacillus halotolerans]|uniref:Peroxiredoxin n=1 Tax=Aureibacillus halotolerans TaxID=1508390 RepID=A0A4R6U4A8_9BACI|nr:TlpA disulfide reductase family protein [Aureibacillus halotolerans]TDQ40312.1 peroxiredoxin [Aureibacillus halotolerans]
MSRTLWRRVFVSLFLVGLVVWGVIDWAKNNEVQASAVMSSMFFWIDKDNDNNSSEPVLLTGPDAEQIKSTLKVGELAPDFSLKNADGETVRLSDYRGKPVLLNFWASWCEPCKEEMPVFQDYYESENPSVQLLTVNATTTERSKKDAVNFVRANGFTFPVVYDTKSEVIPDYRAYYLPVTFMIDADGKLTYERRGPLTEKMLTELLPTS